MKVVVVGAGAMGSLIGGRLARAGIEVVLFDIYEAHVDAINRDGLRIHSVDGTVEVLYPRATADPETARGADFYLFFVKSCATKAVARQFSSLAGDGAIAVTLQNGVGNGDILADSFGGERTAVGVTSQGATFLGPGEIRHAGTGPTYLSMVLSDNSRIEPFVSSLTEAGIETHVEPDVDNLIWSKLVVNVGINALTALTGLQNGQLAAYAGTREFLELLVDEAVSVAQGRGVKLSFDDPVASVLGVAQKTAENRSSMLQDFDRGRPSEIDVINGAIVREGKRLGIPTPFNRAVTLLVQARDQIQSQADRRGRL